MAWESDTQWRTHRSSSSKTPVDWSTQERAGPYSHRDYGDHRIPWPTEDPVRLVANTTYADKEDDKGFEYLDELDEHGARTVGWSWHICCEKMKRRTRDTLPVMKERPAKAESPSEQLFEAIKASNSTHKSQYLQDNQARVASMTIQAMSEMEYHLDS